MTYFVIANNVNTQLAAAAASGATTLTLASSTNLPTLSAGQVMPLTLNDAATGTFYEIVYVTAISGVTLTVTRAQEGTGALNWNIGDYTYCAPTAGTVSTALGNPNSTFQVAAPTAPNQAIPAGQAAGVVGNARNVAMGVPAASATATMTADEIIVETALGGIRYCLANFSKTINLATTGAGGMDTGSAPVSGYVAIYAIYNPTTGASALLARNATSSVQPNVYGGGNMPAGYVASALVSVWPTNASGQFVIGLQFDREIGIAANTSFTTSTTQASLTSFSVAGVIPPNARACRDDFTVGTSSASGGANAVLCGTSVEVGRVAIGGTSPTSNATIVTSFPNIAIVAPQTLYYRASVSAGTLNFTVGINAYTI
ncbi:hypothetical protein [Burkholderia cepacia]|uniref:hypothetical protein n=1 Tax=Burkholderia cepacia TaxID=292 RepID=UPI000A4748FE|nr:hypothetical protein [Burkholderia cepacia]